MASNVLGSELVPCSHDPVTGFYRDGCCETGAEDSGTHVVCAEMTQEFLDFSLSVGNDLSTPQPQFQFPGLSPGDRWCLSAHRWQEALDAGVAPPVILASTHMLAIEWVSKRDLFKHALDQDAIPETDTDAEVEEQADVDSTYEETGNYDTDLDTDSELDDRHPKPISEEMDEIVQEMEDIASELRKLKRDMGRLGQELQDEFGDPDEDTEDRRR